MWTLRLLIVALSCLVLSSMGTAAQTHPAIVSWLINTTNVTGRHYLEGNPTPIADTAKANCQLVQYSADYTYVRCNGIPGYVIGPYRDGNPAIAVGRNYLFKLPLKPTVQTAAKTVVGLGHIGVLINGVPIYNYADARSYNNGNIWHQNAIHFERAGFDCATGHPAPIMGGGGGGGGVTPGQYHHHQNPTAFNIAKVNMSDVCNMYLADGLYVPDSTKHGPLIGFAFDGFPIYGAYGWQTGSTTVTRIIPSYQRRAITDRTTLASGTALTAAQYGPTLAAQALGAYAEDFEYAAGSGDLDEHNGRFCITPEYPEGTYAYFATIDANGVSASPYVIGPTYYGVVVTDNFPARGPGAASTNVKITESVTTYTPNSSTPVVLFTSTAVMAGKQGVPYVYNAKASSNTTDPITFNLTGGPVGMVIDTATGLVSWPSPVMGQHNVSIGAKITASGKVYTATQTYALTIASNAPLTITFTSAPITTGTENIPYSYTLRAIVSDTSRRLIYRFQDSVAGMTLSRQGVLAWQKPVIGTYPISVRAIVIGDTVVSLQSFTLVIKPDSTTGVQESDLPLSSATIYPNPANNMLIVQVTMPLATWARVELLDLAGRSVQQTAINQGSTMCFMDVQTVYAGVYIVRITLGSNSLSYPVVISE